jgi:hypothetical protein
MYALSSDSDVYHLVAHDDSSGYATRCGVAVSSAVRFLLPQDIPILHLVDLAPGDRSLCARCKQVDEDSAGK